ncbi:MAG: hypothetical protein C4518_12325 [Desulfobacteraceae bacterium]|nr:MAG: hypothetical protein C4518_12325 [Desulfobacteraceae bacterium]
MKTTRLEIRPVFVRKEQNIRGHAFVLMLALLLQRELEGCWADMDIAVQEGIDELAAIHVQEIKKRNDYPKIPHAQRNRQTTSRKIRN